MRETFLRTVRCPKCKSDELTLEVCHQDKREIRDARLQCCQCHHSYIVSNGITNFLPENDAVIKNEVEGWLKLAGPLGDGLVPIMAALPYYPHEPWIHVAPDFVQAFELISFAGRRVLDIGAGRCWFSRHIRAALIHLPCPTAAPATTLRCQISFGKQTLPSCTSSYRKQCLII